MNDTKKPKNLLKSLKFENRAWKKAENGSKPMKFFSDLVAIQEYIKTENNSIPKEFLGSNK